MQETSVFASLQCSRTSSEEYEQIRAEVSPAMQVFLDQLAASLRHAEAGNWFHRLLLLDHIEEVQRKILKWVEVIDKKIDGEQCTQIPGFKKLSKKDD